MCLMIFFRNIAMINLNLHSFSKTSGNTENRTTPKGKRSFSKPLTAYIGCDNKDIQPHTYFK